MVVGRERRIVRLLKGWASTFGIRPRAARCRRSLAGPRRAPRVPRAGGELTITLLRDIGVGEEVHVMDEDEILHAIAGFVIGAGQ